MEATNRPVDEGLLEHLLGLESSKIGYYAEVKQKIRELEAINRDLRVRTNELQAVFGAIKDGVAVFDATGRLQYCNGVWAQIFPDAGEEPATCQRFFHPARACDAQGCPVSDALRGEVRDDSFAVETGDGTRYLETTATPIEDADGRFARALVFLRDVTEKRTREIQLLQAEKLTSLGVLAAGVAHEINNPLTSVAGYAEALLRRFRAHGELASDPRLEDFPEYLDVIVREAHRCKTIIESLLSFSRKSERGVGEVNLRALIDEVLQLLGPMARSQGTALLVDTQADVPGVRGDATALRQVILNLATNALQAVGEGGDGAHPPPARTRGRGPRGGGRRPRHPGTGSRADLEPVFHHQGRREGRGPRLGGELQHRPPARRRDLRQERRGPGEHLFRGPARPRLAMTPNRCKILVVDDEAPLRRLLEKELVRSGHLVETAENGESGLAKYREEIFNVVLLDIRMPGLNGIEVLRRMRAESTVPEIIMLTGHGTIESAVECIKEGAYDYLTKPVKLDELELVIQKAAEKNRLRLQNISLRLDATKHNPDTLVGHSPAFRRTLELLARVAPTREPVLITGESGTGKELAARALHALSPRADRPFVAVNCGRLNLHTAESELFGHAAGAFTGATKNRAGVFELADGGTLFLDEVSEMPLDVQVKLLRVLETSTVRRLGGNKDIRVDVRLVFASNRDPRGMG